jgi:hypothetical protein
MNENEQASSNGSKKFDWTFGCQGCQSRKEYLMSNKNDIVFIGLILLGLFAVTRIKIS